jgi:hypothetical protein
MEKLESICQSAQGAPSHEQCGRSTESALLRMQNNIVLALANQKAVLLLLLDMSAAFDTVDLSTLSTLHIEGTVL